MIAMHPLPGALVPLLRKRHQCHPAPTRGAVMADTAITTLVPDPQVAEECGGVTLMTLWRWDKSKKMKALGWPPKVNVNGRNYRNRAKLEGFKAKLEALAERGGK